MKEIEKGSIVTWDSQAQGTWKTKVGTVVEVVPAGKEPVTKLKGMMGYPRKDVSYIVSVPGKTERTKPKLYWPVARSLTLK